MGLGHPWLTAICLLGIGNQIRIVARCSNRIAVLNDFAENYARLLANNDLDMQGKIAVRQVEVQEYLDDIGVGKRTHYPPPLLAAAQPPRILHLALEALNRNLWIDGFPTVLHIAVLQAAGEYSRRLRSALWNALNPLAWANHLVIEPLMNGPFMLASRAGLNR
jgi:hypothetical protein